MNYRSHSVSKFEYEFIQSTSCEEYHCHNCIEIIHLKAGNIRLRTDMSQSVCDLSDGDFGVIASPDVHRCFCMGKCEYELYRFPVSYQNMLEGKLVRSSFVIPHDVLKENIIVDGTISNIMEFLKQSKFDKSVEINLCSTFCSLLMSFFEKQRKKEKASGDSVSGSDIFNGKQSISYETIEKFDKALEYIKENYTKTTINLETLSYVSGLNKTFLSALFPKLTGRNFKEYLNHLRVNRAIELITTSERSISEIAFLCGFDTIRTLNNVFKSIAGVTPSAIRSGISENKASGIDTRILAVGSKIFDYKWRSTVESEKKLDENAFYLFSRNSGKKQWSHLVLRMMFSAGREYSISYKAKIDSDLISDHPVNCNFCFPDDVIKIEHHSPKFLNRIPMDDGWWEYAFRYTVPEYYKPSSLDNFSVYTSPFNDRTVNYYVKDIVVEIYDAINKESLE